jgi:hypothetical protein
MSGVMQITADMIEAAAMAIQAEFANKSGRGRDWRRLQDVLRARYRAEAKAALTAALAAYRAGRMPGREGDPHHDRRRRRRSL